MWSRFLALMLALAGCATPSTTTCADGRLCPQGLVCDTFHGGCVTAQQLVACGEGDARIDEGDGCTIENDPATPAFCDRGVCLPVACSDGLYANIETCDGAPPAVGTCVDFAFDYGVLGCDMQSCSENFASCERLGWSFVAVPGSITGTYRDVAVGPGDEVWVATTRGVGHRAAGSTDWTIELPQARATAIWANGTHVVVSTLELDIANGEKTTFHHRVGDTWTTSTIPGTISDLWGTGPTDLYAVGSIPILMTRVGLVLHWDGIGWERRPDTSDELTGVWGIGSILFATGNNRILQSDDQGMTWSTSAPAPGVRVIGGTTSLAVAAGHNFSALYDGGWKPIPLLGFEAYAVVGTDEGSILVGEDARQTGAILELARTSGRWQRLVTPNTTALRTVAVLSNGLLAGTNAVTTLAWQNAGWASSIINNPVLGLAASPSGNHLVELVTDCTLVVDEEEDFPPMCCFSWRDAAIGDDGALIAVGADGGIGHRRANDSWDCSPFDQAEAQFTDVVIASESSEWVIGRRVLSSGALPPIVVEVVPNGLGWIVEDRSQSLPSSVATLRGIWASNGIVTAVGGDAAGNGVVIRWNGTAWSQMVIELAEPRMIGTLEAIWGTAPDAFYVAGAEGTLLFYNGNTWEPVTLPIGRTISTTPNFTDITGRGLDDVYVVGGRTVLHYDGSGWGPIAYPTATLLESVVTTPRGVLVGGEAGIYTLRGTLR